MRQHNLCWRNKQTSVQSCFYSLTDKAESLQTLQYFVLCRAAGAANTESLNA